MNEWGLVIFGGIVSLVSSTGFWAYIQRKKEREYEQRIAQAKEDPVLKAMRKMLIGLAHDRIMELGMSYIKRGYITRDEYENLHDYLYHPYVGLNGNGTAEKIMLDVARLPYFKEEGGYSNE